MKFLFLPLRLATGLLAGLVAAKVFERLWALIDPDADEPPKPTHRDISVPKLIAALALEGAIFRLTRGAAEHGSQRLVARMTGIWPGEEQPAPEHT
jgi:hypothetical protein